MCSYWVFPYAWRDLVFSAPAPGAGTSSGSPGTAGTAGNPWAGLGGAGTGMPGFGGLGQMDPNTMTEMMNNPMIQQV